MQKIRSKMSYDKNLKFREQKIALQKKEKKIAVLTPESLPEKIVEYNNRVRSKFHNSS